MSGMRGIVAALLLLLLAAPAAAQPVRVATFNAALSRPAPGVLLKEIRRGDDSQIRAAAQVIRSVRPDVLLINELDYDGGLAALTAFRALLATGPDGIDYPHAHAVPSNTGVPSGLDLDGDGTTAGANDAFGWGRFPGQYGMAVLSRFPLDGADSRTFRLLRWADFPDAALPPAQADGWPSPQAREVLRLSSKTHWDVAVDTPDGRLHLFAAHPTPPVFDGPEDRNGRRNHDEILFWVRYLDGWAPTDDAGRTAPRTDAPFVVLGDLNADPQDGDGRLAAVRALLAHPMVQDPAPESAGAVAAAAAQGGANAGHAGPAARDTADWRDSGGPGNLRVDYVLPSAGLTVLAAGVHWPAPGTPGADAADRASDHRLVWVDVALP